MSEAGFLGTRREVVVNQVCPSYYPLGMPPETFVSRFREHVSQLPGEINTAGLVALRSREFSLGMIALHQNVAIRVFIIFPKLDVTPLQCDEFSPSETGTEGSQEQWVLVGTECLCGSEQREGFLARERRGLELWLLRFRQATESRGLEMTDRF